jgi:hypothetical protein
MVDTDYRLQTDRQERESEFFSFTLYYSAVVVAVIAIVGRNWRMGLPRLGDWSSTRRSDRIAISTNHVFASLRSWQKSGGGTSVVVVTAIRFRLLFSAFPDYGVVGSTGGVEADVVIAWFVIVVVDGDLEVRDVDGVFVVVLAFAVENFVPIVPRHRLEDADVGFRR